MIRDLLLHFYVEVGSQKFLRICSVTREILISYSDWLIFYSSFSSKPMLILLCLVI
jgi:hypothetical protein